MSPSSAAPPGLTERMATAYGDLTESERKVCDLVRDAPGEIAVMTGRELAARSGVSTATVSRLFQRLGYASYDEARRAARDLRASGSILHLFDGTAPEADGPGSLIARHLAEEARAMELTLSALNPATAREVAQALAGARRVWCVGFRNSHVLAEYAATLFSALRPDVELLAQGGRSLAERVASITPGDVALVFGMRRRMAHFVPLMQAIRDGGADTVLFCDRSLRSPTARWVLHCTVETTQPIDCYAGPFALIRLLALMTLRNRGAGAPEMLGRVERLHRQLGELE